jgi:hypothetical protein
MRSYSYGFPEAVLDAGKEEAVKVDLHGVFRPQKLVMFGSMDVIRGSFRIKRSRLPELDRDDVIASSTRVYRGRRGKKVWFRKGKTTIEFQGNDKVLRRFTRTYLPSSVEYLDLDPLSYIALKQLFCGTEAAMANFEGGISGQMFGADQLGNSLPLPTTSSSVTLLLKNHGDIQVRVRASIFGIGL